MRRLKVAVDVNMSPRLAKALNALYAERGFEFIFVGDIVPANARDEFWAAAFCRFGGEVVLSADKRISSRPHERKAFETNRLISFFMAPAWSQQPYSLKAAHAVYWWPRIAEHVATADLGSCWLVPMGFGRGEFKRLGIPADAVRTASTRGRRAK